MMPGMDGVDLVRRLRAAGRQTPVLNAYCARCCG
jgi:CheY-like chemotaxis protein